MTEKLIDVLASEARTALDDPAGLDVQWGGGDFASSETAQRAYAIERLDEIIGLLNPSEETTEAYARTLKALGRQLAERQDAIEQDELSYPEHDEATREAYTEAHGHLTKALDALDAAIDALRSDDAETMEYELADSKGRPDQRHPGELGEPARTWSEDLVCLPLRPSEDDTPDPVLTFTPRERDGAKFVAEDYPDLFELLGGFVGAEQCDGCGNHTYRIEMDAADRVRVFHAVCAVDPDESDEFKHTDPCGTRYQIRWEASALTVF